MNMKKSAGFTLIELMIVVAVIGILGAIAYPSYQESVRKARRAEGRVAVMEVLQQQEKYATQYNTYLEFSSGAENIPMKAYSGSVGKSTASFWVESKACESQSIKFCVEVVGVPKYTDSKVTSISITSTGVKNCNGTTSSDCWQ